MYWEYRKNPTWLTCKKKGEDIDNRDINRDYLLEDLIGHRTEHGIYSKHDDNPGKGFQQESGRYGLCFENTTLDNV